MYSGSRAECKALTNSPFSTEHSFLRALCGAKWFQKPGPGGHKIGRQVSRPLLQTTSARPDLNRTVAYSGPKQHIHYLGAPLQPFPCLEAIFFFLTSWLLSYRVAAGHGHLASVEGGGVFYPRFFYDSQYGSGVCQM